MATVFGLAFSAVADDEADELQLVQDRVSSLFSEISPEYVVPSPVDGWYTIRKGAIVAYISADGKYLMQVTS